MPKKRKEAKKVYRSEDIKKLKYITFFDSKVKSLNTKGRTHTGFKRSSKLDGFKKKIGFFNPEMG